jgi:hypothetical protein
MSPRRRIRLERGSVSRRWGRSADEEVYVQAGLIREQIPVTVNREEIPVRTVYRVHLLEHARVAVVGEVLPAASRGLQKTGLFSAMDGAPLLILGRCNFSKTRKQME